MWGTGKQLPSASTHKLEQVTLHIKKSVRNILVNHTQEADVTQKTANSSKAKSVTLVGTQQIEGDE